MVHVSQSRIMHRQGKTYIQCPYHLTMEKVLQELIALFQNASILKISHQVTSNNPKASSCAPSRMYRMYRLVDPGMGRCTRTRYR